jgi:hypothetical protein
MGQAVALSRPVWRARNTWHKDSQVQSSNLLQKASLQSGTLDHFWPTPFSDQILARPGDLFGYRFAGRLRIWASLPLRLILLTVKILPSFHNPLVDHV